MKLHHLTMHGMLHIVAGFAGRFAGRVGSVAGFAAQEEQASQRLWAKEEQGQGRLVRGDLSILLPAGNPPPQACATPVPPLDLNTTPPPTDPPVLRPP